MTDETILANARHGFWPIWVMYAVVCSDMHPSATGKTAAAMTEQRCTLFP